MKKVVKTILMGVILLLESNGQAKAQIEIATVIANGVKKVIKAVDLRIQRLQNQTIWLQNAQKAIENTLSKLRLDEITDWAERQRVLYADYFDELARVKSVLATYRQVQSIITQQVRIVNAYKSAYTLFKTDDNFTVQEILHMGKIYAGLLERSLHQLDKLFLAIQSFTTSMSDAKRLEIIQSAGAEMQETYQDLTQFNQQNVLLRLQRAKDKRDIDKVRQLYGLPLH
ncbi:MAG: conjugal transfer protein TraI [Chitinophagaceae bacterium]|nr:conjugal transfer protein TraI [Chitinophagaceae bacterium]